MQKTSFNILDFDRAMELARTDPAAFELYRQNVIEALIARAAERNRQHLRCLQWRIDRERERASSPFAACIKLYRMMWESFAGERGLANTLQNAHQSRQDVGPERPKAKVISFPGSADSRRSSES